MSFRAVLALGALGLLAGALFLLSDEGGPSAEPSPRRSSGARPAVERAPAAPRAPVTYKTPSGEVYKNAKVLAGRTVERLTTYPEGTSARALVKRLPASVRGASGLRERLDPLVDQTSRSRGEVIYPQLGGVTPTGASVMVVLRQRRLRPDGGATTETRTVDVRLRRAGGPWRVADIVSVGGRRASRPGGVSGAARAVLDNDRIELPDSARWDIYRGGVDERLLRRMDEIAERFRYSVAVLDTGHPKDVFAMNRRSAHSQGYAVDIWKVDGRRVVRQRRQGSRAFTLARSLVAGGATQLGSPWAFGNGSFTDPVHQDHLHLQQAPTSGPGTQPPTS